MTHPIRQTGVDALATTQMADEDPSATDAGQLAPSRQSPPVCQSGRTYAGQYLVKGLLGDGGMAEVYLVEHRTLRAEFALKVLRPTYQARPDIVQRFRDESRALWELSHPSFVRVHHAGDDPEIGPYIVMEVLRGKTLAQVLQLMGRLDVADALQIAVDVAEACQAMHGLGIIHRDLKPENIFLPLRRAGDERRPIRLLDLGAAKIAKYGGPTTAANHVIGTGRYMSPEHIQGQPLGPPSDIYSLAHIVYEMVSGKHTFGLHHPDPSHFEFHVWHLNAAPEPLAARVPGAPQDLSDALGQAMEKLPQRRFQTMAALAVALREVLRRFEALKARGGTAQMELPPQQPLSIDEALSAASPDGSWSYPPTRESATRAHEATAEVETIKSAPSSGQPTNAEPVSVPRSSATSAAGVAHLVALDGPAPGGVHGLQVRTYAVGRDPAVDLHVNDPSLAPRHARVVVHPTGITEVYDDSGAAGVFVNERTSAYAVLKHGDRLRLGRVTFEFRLNHPDRHAFGSRGTVRLDAPEDGAHVSPAKAAPRTVAMHLPDVRGTGWQAGPALAPAPTAAAPPGTELGSAPRASALVEAPQRARTSLLIVALVLLVCALIGAAAVARRAGLLGAMFDHRLALPGLV